MKNLKKLSAAFFTAVLLSSGLTSCIDNEVSPLVESIYANQAELLAAQTAVQQANATLLLAQAAVQEANAANQAAITAAFTASSAQDLLEQIAETELAVEEARLAMLLAQADFDRDMASILASIRQAQNNEAGQHAADYATAMTAIATLNGTKLTTQQSIATKELYMKSAAAGAEMTWAVYLAGLERDVLAKQASVTSNEEFIVRANAYIAGDYADMVDALAVATAAQAAKQAEIDVLDAEDTQIDADILATTGNFDQYITDFETMEGEKATLEGDIATEEGNVTTLTTVTIPGLEAIIADYDATTVLLQADVDAAKLVIGSNAAGTHANNHAPGFGLLNDIDEAGDDVTAATTALGVYGAAPDFIAPGVDSPRTGTLTPQDVKWNADLALGLHNEALAALNATYQTAIANLATEQGLFDAGSGTANANLVTAQGNLTTGQNLVTSSQTTYDLMKAAFEAAPTGFVWTTGIDGVLGIHPTAVGPHASYSVVTAITPVVVGAVNVSAGSGADLTALGTYASFLAGTMDGGGAEVVAVNDYYNVGNDDVAGGTNAQRLDNALVALTSAQNAIAGLQSDVDAKQLIVDNFGDDLADALAVYNAQKALYEGGLATKTTLEGDVTAAAAGVTTATGLVTAATDAKTLLEDELGYADYSARVTNSANLPLSFDVHANDGLATPMYDVLASAGWDSVDDGDLDSLTAYAILWNAQNALDIHTATTLAAYNTQLATAQTDLVDATRLISEYNILLVRKTADIAALQAEYDALIATPEYAAQQVRLLEIADELAVLNAEKAVLDAEVTALAVVVSFEGYNTLALVQGAITTAQGVIDGAPAYYDMKAAQIALGEVSVDNLTAEIAELTAELANLDARIAAKTVEAEGYLALLNAALGN